MTDHVPLQDLVARRVATRLFSLDSLVFAPPEAADVHASVRTRLGWVDAPETMRSEIAAVDAVAREVRHEGLTDVYLLGMGGSSLCAEVLRDVPNPRQATTRLVVLDTTDEQAIQNVRATLVPERSLFVVASKSGSTIEVTSLERYFWSVMAAARPGDAGRHFLAITDPGTSLVAHASAHGYRHTFVNPADIGGRYSALSLFGLVPASLLGLDIAGLIAAGAHMVEECRRDDAANPGLALGAFMGAQARAGRDKLTLLLAPSLAPLGPWIEQLVAESTGKLGRGVLPVVDEPPAAAGDYGADRAFVAVLAPDGHEIRATTRALEQAGQPVFTIEASAGQLGAEFYRWEFATAVAGVVLGVNPFDEPNVRDAKMRTQGQLDTRARTGAFAIVPPLTASGPHVSRREHRVGAAEAHIGRYVAVLDYVPADATRPEVVGRLREAIRRRSGVATTYGVGPRYLHSTGQYHKGGPNSGRFILLTAADRSATVVPGTDYTFSVLKQAQALGDYEALVAAGREVVHYHFDDPAADFSRAIESITLDLD